MASCSRSIFRRARMCRREICSRRLTRGTYQAQLDQAKAKKAQDEAQLANAKLMLSAGTHS